MQTTVFFPYKDISETGMKRAVSSNYYHHAKMEDVSESSLNVLPEAGSDIKKKSPRYRQSTLTTQPSWPKPAELTLLISNHY